MNNGICNNCKRKFPDHLINVLFSNDGGDFVCPICGLKLRNKMHGLPENTPFHGEMAQQYYDEAIEFLERNQNDK